MRPLNLAELEDKFYSYTYDIQTCDKKFLTEKLNQLMYFLYDQPISNRILERIDEDFNFIKLQLPPVAHNNINSLTKKAITHLLKDRETQGAFGYFIIDQFYKDKENYENYYLEMVGRWYNLGGDYFVQQQAFNEYFFNPFIELIKWYVDEGKSKSEKDFYSKEEISEILNRLDDMGENMSIYNQQREHGQEIIFNEIEELKDLIKTLNKKNWGQIARGKLGDLVTASILTPDNARMAYNFLSDSGIIPTLGL